MRRGVLGSWSDADQGERSHRRAGHPAQRGGDGVVAGQTQAADGHIAQDRHHLGRRAAHRPVVLVKGIAPVAGVAEPVLDPPVPPDVARQLRQVGPRRISAGDHVDPFAALLLGAELGTVALHSHHLPGPGETEFLPDVGGGDLSAPVAALLQPTVSLVPGDQRRGKKRCRESPPAPPATGVGCP